MHSFKSLKGRSLIKLNKQLIINAKKIQPNQFQSRQHQHFFETDFEEGVKTEES